MRRRGASPGRPVRVLESRTVVVGNKEPGGFAGNYTGDLPGSFGFRRAEPSHDLTNLEVTMKMVKSLLLGSAAGLVAVAGAQAADLPVKAKPVEYVKVCSIYGAGFFYIPGTDTCIKIGGWVRAEYAFQSGNSDAPFIRNTGGSRNDRVDTNEYQMRARTVTSLDVRTQTEYGTLRAYILAGFQTTTGETTQGRIYTERGFI